MEKQKIWLLPLLGLGVAGVVYMNIRMFTGTPAPAAATPATAVPPEQASSAPPVATSAPVLQSPPSQASGIAPAAQSGGEGDTTKELWKDLKDFAVVPPACGEEGPLRERALTRLVAELVPKAPPAIRIPDQVSVGAVPVPKTAPKPLQAPGALEVPVPDFVTRSASGAVAWFQGRPYRTGESLEGRPYRVVSIGRAKVELAGPAGKIWTHTNALHSSGPSSRPSQETP